MTGKVVEGLKSRGATLAVAESCTGGRLAAAFTASAGASDYFLGGVVAYDNEVKIGVLGVSHETIETYGAVSRQVAGQMARGVRRITGADFTLATTGIAGPGGATAEKPVGLVYVAFTNGKQTRVKKCNLTGDRNRIRSIAVLHALDMLRRAMIEE